MLGTEVEEAQEELVHLVLHYAKQDPFALRIKILLVDQVHIGPVVLLDSQFQQILVVTVMSLLAA